MTTVEGKRAIVTGGANGIGFQFCQELLQNGAKAVAILDLPNSNGEESARKLNEKFGEGRAFFIPSDVVKFDEFAEVVKKATTVLQGLDILINNAGIIDDRDFKKAIDVNFAGVVNGTLVGYDSMGKHKGGRGGIIVNVSSVGGFCPAMDLPVYTGTKYAVLGFTISMKNYYEKTGISLRVICPGLTDTQLTSSDKYLPLVDPDEASARMRSYYHQPSECVGKALIEIIEKGENGSVWVCQVGEPPFEIDCLGMVSKIKLNLPSTKE